MLGIAIATVIDGADVLLTDLPEAQEIVESNTDRAVVGDSSLRFQMLDWDIELPANLQSSPSQYDLIVAADCTYNPDSRHVDLTPNIVEAAANYAPAQHSSIPLYA